MPISPIGTLGAVIAMHPGMGNRKSLFDIAITGPLAGLVPALAFSYLGLSMSEVQPLPEEGGRAVLSLGEPLLFAWMRGQIFGPLPDGHDVFLHPLAFAGWVGIFITALNLIPIGQLDGGHILYALLRQAARPLATLLLMLAAASVVIFGYWAWTLMLVLLLLIGPRHPPTADDSVPLDTARIMLGWASLLFILVGFTPTPFILPGG
jgi:membrane-associated protease RseP (regulator of RpoE activity)